MIFGRAVAWHGGSVVVIDVNIVTIGWTMILHLADDTGTSGS